MASISSMNTMQGAYLSRHAHMPTFLRASAKSSRTRLAPMPTNISTKSQPDMLMNGTFASPAAAFTSSVLPVPGGPVRMAPYP